MLIGTPFASAIYLKFLPGIIWIQGWIKNGFGMIGKMRCPKLKSMTVAGFLALIVEFAIAKQKEGATIIDAAKEGAFSRLRPILMTSFAFVAGLIPLMLASGAGAIGNRTIGTASAGGMILGTVGGLLVIPGLYVVFASLSAKMSKNEK
jgi:Cu/Ag efflux pump CusA